MMTAYHGVRDVLKVQPEHTVVIANAGGSVGSFAVQIAKHICGARRVIGIAGPRKTEFVLSLGADAVVDYTAPDFPQRLLEAVGPDLADRHLESVGGAVFNAAIAAVKPHGVIGFCGMLSTYNGGKMDWSNFIDLAWKAITLQGFTVFDTVAKWPERIAEVDGWIRDGKISVAGGETVVEARVEDIPAAWQHIFEHKGTGKLVTKLVQ
jgi:NADPH-dependent curcumin reductase CurA